MDFSVKNLKKNILDKKIKNEEDSVTQKILNDKKSINSKEFKKFVEQNKAYLLESALNKKMGAQLLTSPFYEKWWNNGEITKFLLDRGFEIIDFDNDHFGVWFGEIHQLDYYDLKELEKSLTDSYEQIDRVSNNINNRRLQEVIGSYKSNDVPQINVLRLLVVFQKLLNLNYFVDEDDESGLDVADIDIVLREVEENMAVFLPNNFSHFVSEMDGKTENFSVSWRIPNESSVQNDGLTAANLNWLASKMGNQTFLKLYEMINEYAEASKSFIELNVDKDESDFFSFDDKNLLGLKFEISIEDLKRLFEILDFKVSIKELKSNSYVCKISWE